MTQGRCGVCRDCAVRLVGGARRGARLLTSFGSPPPGTSRRPGGWKGPGPTETEQYLLFFLLQYLLFFYGWCLEHLSVATGPLPPHPPHPPARTRQTRHSSILPCDGGPTPQWPRFGGKKNDTGLR